MNDPGYISYRMAQIISRSLSRRFAYWLGLRISDRFFARDHAGRSAVMSNLAQILCSKGVNASEDTLKLMARNNFQMFGKYIVDFFKFADFTDKRVRQLVSMEHIKRIDDAQSLGRGVIMFTAHLGNWELGGAVLASLGIQVNAVIQPARSNRVNELFQRHREKRGIKVIPMGSAARGVLHALRRNECVAMLADRDYTAHNELISFFGKPARLPSGPARIAAKTGAPLVPAFLLRQPDDTFLFRIHNPILPDDFHSIDDIRIRIKDVMEEEISRNPLQWFMFTDFWTGGSQ